MIIRPGGDTHLLITQPDHAALAARIMEHWSAGGLVESPRRDDILLAILEHDNGWDEVDAAPQVDARTGGLLDFMHVPDEVRQGVWPRAVARLAATPYAAALVAQHALHIFMRFRGRADWAPFFARMEALRDEQLRASTSVRLETLLADYPFLRLADLLSLTFCNTWTEVQGEEHGYAIRLDGSRLLIAPDPFRGREIPLAVPARELPNRRFDSVAEAAAAWAAAPVRTLQGVLLAG